MKETNNQEIQEEQRRKAFLEFMENHKKVKALGFAGVLPNGNMVDRRKFPDAIPLQFNTLLNIPKPHPMPRLKEVKEALKAIPNSKLIWDEKDECWAYTIF